MDLFEKLLLTNPHVYRIKAIEDIHLYCTETLFLTMEFLCRRMSQVSFSIKIIISNAFNAEQSFPFFSGKNKLFN